MKSFDDAPFLVIWELTQACDLACVHCRACAVEKRHPLELTTGRGLPIAQRDSLLRRTVDGVHRRRSPEAAGPVRLVERKRAAGPAHYRDSQCDSVADPGGHRANPEMRCCPYGDQPGWP